MSETASTLRVIDRNQVIGLLPFSECVEIVRNAMMTTSERRVHLPLRQGMPLPNQKGLLGIMPGYLGDPECFGIKLVSLFPGNASLGISSHSGLYLLYEAQTGQPLALMDASVLTRIRTPAATVVAAQALAGGARSKLAILGTGEQARAHADAFCQVYPFERVTIWGRNQDAATQLVQSLDAEYECVFEVGETVGSTVANADVICTVTFASEPILRGRDVPTNSLLCLVGSSIPDTAEVDQDAVVRSRYFVDYKESTLAQAGELLRAIDNGVITTDHIVGEIGDVLSGNLDATSGSGDFTIYKSLGVASQDLASAMHVYKKAEQRDIGVVAGF